MNRLLLVCLFALIISVTFVACAWQFDILSAPLVYQIKDEPFYYWWWSWSKWTHYAWTFWGMGICFFICVVSLILSSWRNAKMKVKFDLDPTVPKVVIIAILLFVETVCLAAYAILLTGRLPTDVECLTILCGAVLPLVTYLLTFLKYGEKEKAESE